MQISSVNLVDMLFNAAKLFFPYFLFSYKTIISSILATLLLFIDVLCVSFAPKVLGKSIIDASSYQSFEALVYSGIIYVLLSTSSRILPYLSNILLFNTVNIAINDIHKRLLTHLNKMPFDIFSQLNAAEIMSASKRISPAARKFIVTILLHFIPHSLKIIGAIIFLSEFNQQHFFAMIFCILAVVVLYYSIIYFIPERQKSWNITDSVYNTLNSALINNKVLRYSFGEDKHEIFSQLDNEAKRWAKANTKYYMINIYHGILKLIAHFCIIVYGVYLLKYGEITVGSFVAINMFMRNIFTYMSYINSDLKQIITVWLDIEKVSNILNIELLQYKYNSVAEVAFKDYDIILTNVSFAYDKNMILNDVNLSIMYGETIALLGSNGVGKSSLCSLISGLYRRQSGVLTIGGYDINDLAYDVIGDVLYFAPQDILHTSPITAEIERSYGEKQLSIIDYILHTKHKILILDEITSSLSRDAELEFFKKIKTMKNTTVIIATHNSDIINYVDRVYRLT